MNALTHKLDQLEARLQDLIEGRLARLLPRQESMGGLAHQLVTATRLNSITLADGRLLAPSHFILQAGPLRAAQLLANPAQIAELASWIAQEGQAAGLTFDQAPQIEIVAEEDLTTDQVIVVARLLQTAGATTQVMSAGLSAGQSAGQGDGQGDGDQAAVPQNAFLIVDGLRIYPLERAVINIGRRGENDLVIDDPRVSREHCQLRATHGKYLLFDLGSSGGTFVNKQRITRSSLRAGDVISLAGFPLVYGQESGSDGLGQTQEIFLPEE